MPTLPNNALQSRPTGARTCLPASSFVVTKAAAHKRAAERKRLTPLQHRDRRLSVCCRPSVYENFLTQPGPKVVFTVNRSSPDSGE